MSIPTIQPIDYKSAFVDKFAICLLDGNSLPLTDTLTVKKLVELLGAINPYIILQTARNIPYLVADSFTTIQADIDRTYREGKYDIFDFDAEKVELQNVSSYNLHVECDIDLPANLNGCGLIFVQHDKLKPEQEPSGETLHLIEWIDAEYSIDRWLDKTADELKSMFHELLYSGLNSRSIADTLNDIIITTLTYRVDYQYIINYLNGRKQEEEFIGWVQAEFTPAGSNYFLSNNPNDFNQYDLGLLIDTYNLINGSKVKSNDHIEHNLSTLSIA